MDTVGKLIAAALLCSVICLLLKKQAPELTLCLCVLVCALCFLTSFPFFSPILAFFHRLQELKTGALANIAERSGREQDKEDGGLETLRRNGYM